MKTLLATLLFVNFVLSTFTVTNLSSFTAVQYTRIGTKLSFINATAIGAIPFDGCALGSRDRNEGKILVVSEGLCDPALKGKYATETGAIALVVVNSFAIGIANSFPSYSSAAKSVNVPIYDVVDNNGALINFFSKQENNASATLTPDPSPLHNEVVTYLGPILLGIPALATIAIGSWKLYYTIRFNGLKMNTMVAVLTIEVVSSIFRFLLFLEPPDHAIYDWAFATSIFSVTWPLSYITSLLLAFYWAELLRRVEGKTGLKAGVMSSMKRMKIPFIVVAILVVSIEFVTNLLRSGRLATQVGILAVNSVLSVIISFGVSLFYIINGGRLLRFLHICNNNASSMLRLRRITTLLTISGIGMGVFFIGAVLLISNTEHAHIYFIAYFMIFGGLVITSLGHVLAFKTKSQSSSSTSEKKSGISSSSPQTIERNSNVVSAELAVV